MSEIGSTGSANDEKPGAQVKDPKGDQTTSPLPLAGVNMATIEDDDERLLARLGYRQVGVSDPVIS